MLSLFWSLFSSQPVLILDCVFSNNNVHVAWTLLQPISLPYPHQTMVRGPTRKMTTWLLSTLYRGRGVKFKYCHQIVPTLFSIIVDLDWVQIFFRCLFFGFPKNFYVRRRPENSSCYFMITYDYLQVSLFFFFTLVLWSFLTYLLVLPWQLW